MADQAKLSPNDTVVLCGLSEEQDYDLDDPLDGHIGVVVRASLCAGSWVVRLLHRDPACFVNGQATGIASASAHAAIASSAAADNSVVAVVPTESLGPDLGCPPPSMDNAGADFGCVPSPLEEPSPQKDPVDDPSAAPMSLCKEGDELLEMVAALSLVDDEIPDDMLERIQSLMSVPRAPSLKRNLSTSTGGGNEEDWLERHDVVLPAQNLKKIINMRTTISLNAFHGYVEIRGNVCGAGMLAGAVNCAHGLKAPPVNLSDIPAVSQQRPLAELPLEAEHKKARALEPMGLKDALTFLHKVATVELGETEKSLARRPGDLVLEKRAKRLQKSQKSLLDTYDPNTWQIGNMDIEKAMQMLGLSGGVLLSREVKPTSVGGEDGMKNWLWGKLKGALALDGTTVMFHLHGVLNGDCYFGHYALIFAVAEYENVEVASAPLDSKKNVPSPVARTVGAPGQAGRKGSSPAPLTAGRRGSSPAPASGRRGASPAPTPATPRGPKRQLVVRKVLTARSYQGPRHWLDLDQVYRFVFKAKFPGYQIWRYSRR